MTVAHKGGRPQKTRSSGRLRSQWQHEIDVAEKLIAASDSGKLEYVQVKKVRRTIEDYQDHVNHIDALDVGDIPADMNFMAYIKYLKGTPEVTTPRTPVPGLVETPYGLAFEQPDGSIRLAHRPKCEPGSAVEAMMPHWLKRRRDGHTYYLGEYFIEPETANG